ncbi:Stk1 family PASTA domain-containing Ser/Thr kinase [Acetivibrio straminisolvens]|jgi:serine/threonine-protein kinase|uniref:non-specific serine/threonine protein kinase n=1 Tax=Acetivibrio straminisolvens JCM 21531 TaxID=1294263 RepID=W4V019_9FIRM|nr:Stk1 family PASTA domain-containing Ser/Thr kinase [Acetivibrio straminisolvens]GAE86850.1 serine/threonine protein kinase PrkC [Acetivibrio straminisolvens JCM 21531]
MVGQILGNRYELIEKIGGGGMALVYKAKCRLLNRFVAVKILKSEFINDEEFLKRFKIEAQAAASLSHPNIVSIYDVGHENDIHYIVMEYVNGQTLKEYIEENGALYWKDAVNIAIQITQAIEHAHKNHIVHRDIKPHNILFTKDGMLKVTDFGIARAVSSSTITMAGNTIGSVHYFSPEQARGGFTDEKSDLYSLGIVLYELLTGMLPFDGESPVAVAIKHIQDEPAEPVSIKEDIPAGVNSIVMRAIQKDQTLRYQSASELLRDLHRVLKEPDAQFMKARTAEDSPTVRIPSIKKKELAIESDTSKKAGDEMVQKKKKDNKTTILAVVTSILVILVLGAFMITGLGDVVFSMFSKPEDFVVEDYRNQNFYEVKGKLSQYDIKAVEIRKNHDDIPKDIIISQDKAVGEKIKPGEFAKIEFEVSNGPLLVKIPDLRRMEYRQAEIELIQLGLKPEKVEEYNDIVSKGVVIRTEPDINEEVKPGTVVKVYKSLGPEIKYSLVPNLVGKTKSEALNLLVGANLTMGKIFPEDMTYARDKIIRQEPKAGVEVEEGTPVNIYLEDYNPDQKLVARTIELDNPDNFGENIKLLVNITRSDTNKVETLYSEVRKKSDFPITISIPVPNGGSTFVRVYLDNKSYMEFTEEFNKRNTENTTRNNNTENNAEKTEEAKEANETNEASQTESAEEV